MTKPPRKPAKTDATGYVLGRKGFAKISAVEGIILSPEMETQFRDFDRKGLSAVERRIEIARTLGKAR